MRRVRLLISELRSIRARDLRQAAPDGRPAGEQPAHTLLLGCWSAHLRTKRLVFKVYKSSMSPERWQQVTARAIRYCANDVFGTRLT